MEETDYQGPSRELEREADDMQDRRDKLERETDEARQDIRTKVSDQRVPGVQDEQEDILEGRKAVEQREEEPDEGEEEGEGDSEGGGSREDEE